MDRREALKQSALLMGVTMSGAVFTGMLQGCTVDASDDFTPRAFTPEEFKLISVFCDLIIPTTDTPGARDLFVDRLVDELAANSFNEKILANTRQGLGELREKLDNLADGSFVEAKEELQLSILSRIDESIEENHIYRSLKGIIIYGYFTSEEVGKNILSYDPIPGSYQGCIPASEVGNAWTLRN